VVLNEGQVRVAEGTIFTNGVNQELAEGLYYNQTTATTQIDGKFRITGGKVSNSGAIAVGTTGQYLQYGGTTVNTGHLSNAGTVEISERTVFNNTIGQASAVGQHIQEASGTMRINGTFSNSARVLNNGEISVGINGLYSQVPSGQVAAVTTNNGTFTNAGRVMVAGPSVFVNNGQYLQQSHATTQLDGTFANRNLVTNGQIMTVGTTGSYVQTGGFSSTANTGTFTNVGSTNIVEGQFANHGVVVNSGTFSVASVGHVTGTGTYTQIAPTAPTTVATQTIIDGTFSNNIDLQLGLLSGSGTVTGAVVNTAGVVRPGGNVAPGTLTLASYTQAAGGRLDFKIGGYVAGIDYDVLKVTGPVSLSGSVQVTLLNGFQPNVGDKFDLLRGDRLTLGSLLFTSDGPSLTGLLAGITSLSFVQGHVGAPEPSRLLIMGLGFAWLVLWQCRTRRLALK
jgi:hypothetical protein